MRVSRHIAGAAVFAATLATTAPALGAGWVYVESNNPGTFKNSVLALPYGTNGKPSKAGIRAFKTRGAGAAFIDGHSAGTLAGDQQITVSRDHKWLFAVNQGSNSIAVFRVNTHTGALKHVKGSPFASGGRAPISIGYNGRHLVVANHGVRAPFDAGPTSNFGNPNFTSFRVSGAGKLTKISTVPALAGPTQAAIPASGRNVLSTSFFGFGSPANETIQSVTLSSTGQLAEGAGSPTGFPASVTGGLPPLPAFLPPGIEKLAFGIATHPTKPYAYIAGPVNSRVATYGFDNAGVLTFVGQADNPGSVAACWIVLTSDGKYLYTSNSGSQDISLFTVSPAGDALTFVELVKIPSTGTDFNLAIDPTDSYLYAVAGHDDPDAPRPQEVKPDGTIISAPAPANYIEAYKIGSGGKLKSISTTTLPGPKSLLPYGLATVGKK